jgi:hypothetical protein
VDAVDGGGETHRRGHRRLGRGVIQRDDRDAPQVGRWKHVKYPGWVQWDDAPGGLLIAEIRTRVKGHAWQIMEAFIGYLDRHLGERIDSISIYYR